MSRAPDLDHTGRTPYVEYTDVDVLRAAVHPKTDEPLEVTFVVGTQIMELHFLLIAHEWRVAMDALQKREMPTAVEALERSVANQRSLLAGWSMLDRMSPVQYNRFRDHLGNASGFQSYGYRELEFLLGVKDPHLLRPHRGMTEVHASLQATFDAPSLFEIATDVVRERVDPPIDVDGNGHEEAVQLWLAAYGRDDLIPLAEVLTAVADHHMRWRFVHYQAVRRILGDKPGTAGSSGLTWLKRAVDAPVFPALWEVRSLL